MAARRFAIASIGHLLEILTITPERLGEDDTRCHRCRSPRGTNWNPVANQWQCWTCRTQWSEEKVQITYRQDLTEYPDYD